MITGFNTDVRHEDHVYHVQTEDRGRDNPVFESIIYVGGTVVAKKRTPYADKLIEGATEEIIASLLKKQHQVIIAAIKAGRIKDLIQLSASEHASENDMAATRVPVVKPPPVSSVAERPVREKGIITVPNPAARPSVPLGGERPKADLRETPVAGAIDLPKKRGETRSLDLDQVLADYRRKNQQQAKLDIKVISPNTFIAGKSIGLRVLVSADGEAMADVVVTVKVIGTAFKPQVYIGRTGKDGVANFSLTLPPFTAGTAAIVIESQSEMGRGELKHLIRRA